MGWSFYGLDQVAQRLVLAAKARDRDSLNQSFKMRESVAYGLERFWGEHLRLEVKEQAKSEYWKETWDAFVDIMARSQITIPNDSVSVDNTKAVTAMAEKLWTLEIEEQRIALAVLTQLCDSLVWWTQRYKGSRNSDN